MPAFSDYKVADISLADWGRREIAIAETEMPGLMALRQEYGKSRPLKGARLAGSLHMTLQTAVLIETLKALGADVRWVSCNIYSTQDHAAAAVAAAGVPVFAVKGESLKDYWDYTAKLFEWHDGGTPNMILDDGGDATMFVHQGYRAEQGDTVFLDQHNSEEEEIFFALIKRMLKEKPKGWFGQLAKDIITIEHMRKMKDRAVVCNIGHFDNEIQIASLKNLKWDNIKPQVDEITFPDGHRIILLSEGRLVNLGNAMGHPSFVMSASFTNQTLAQMEIFCNPGKYQRKVYTLPKGLDEKVARLHLAKIGAKLTQLSDKQSTYLGVPQQGPFKADSYRY